MAKKQKNTRRGNNEGCIYQRPNGTWNAIVSLGYDETGKLKRKTYYGKTRAEVAQKMTTDLDRSFKGGKTSVANDSFETLLTEWLMTFKRAAVSNRSFEGNVRMAKLHIIPAIGELKLHEITPPVLQKLFNKMIVEGYALPTVKKAKFILNQFFEYAIESGFVEHSPVTKTKLKSRERKDQTEEKYKALPTDVRAEFLTILEKSEILKPICMTMMFAGLRAGEVLALRWKDIDFKNMSINVDNAITTDTQYDKAGNVIDRPTVISDTKTAASIREVPIPRALETALKEWYAIRKARQEKTGISFTKPGDLVFSNNEGQLRNYYGIRCMFDKLLHNSPLKKYGIHFHTLRHTYSSMLFEAGENPKVIQMLLGHKDVKTTITTYNSVDKKLVAGAVHTIDAKYDEIVSHKDKSEDYDKFYTYDNNDDYEPSYQRKKSDMEM